jgi:hypothetical protein
MLCCCFNRAKRWAINIRREDLVDKSPEYLNRNCYVCGEHFEGPMFLNDLRNRLHHTAVPTIVDVPNPPPKVFATRRKRRLFHEEAARDVPLKQLMVAADTSSEHAARVKTTLSSTVASTSVNVTCSEQFMSCIEPLAKSANPLADDCVSENIQTFSGTRSCSCVVQCIHSTDNESFTSDVESVGSCEKTTKNSGTQTSLSLSGCTPRKECLRKTLQTVRVINWRLNRARQAWKKKYAVLKQAKKQPMLGGKSLTEHLVTTGKFLSKEGKNFLLAQLHLASKRAKGRRYSNEFKCMALAIYYKGPKAYKFLASMFALPSRSTLNLWLQGMTVPAGFSKNVFEILQMRTSQLTERNRVCALLIDEMAIKANLAYDKYMDVVVGYENMGGVDGLREPSKHVAKSCLTFMVRGIALNWKQAVGYVMTQSGCKVEVLKSLVFDCIEKLHSIGLNVVVVISDQGSNFLQLTKHLGVCPEKPYFEKGDKTYFYLFDPSHLIKSVRNNLNKYDFCFDDNKTAKWKDIVDFYKLDEQQRFRLAPKLTKKHIELPPFSKMKVKLATQVISRTVAAGLDTHAKIKGLQGSDTAEFLYVFDELFDAMNSSQRTCIKRYKCAITNDSGHFDLFQQRLTWLDSLRAIDKSGKNVTKTIKCLTGWKITLSAVMQLWPLLLNKYAFTFLLTRRLNQDPLENFFSVIRQRGGKCENPSPLAFSRLFKQICCQSILAPVVGANCEFDSASNLQSVINATPVNRPVLSFSTLSDHVAVNTPMLYMQCENDCDFEGNGLYYVCGFLLRKLLKFHSCDVCNALWINNTISLNNGIYTNCRLYCSSELKQGKGLVTVSESFFSYVTECESVFATLFDNRGHEPGILHLIVKEQLKIPAPVACKQFPKVNFLKYFVRMRIYYKLKFLNRTVSSSNEETKQKPRKNRKLAKLQHT